jgi:hypothetical protein
MGWMIGNDDNSSRFILGFCVYSVRSSDAGLCMALA